MTDDLTTRLEAGPGSRALEVEMAHIFGWFRYTRAAGCTMRHGGWISPEDFTGADKSGRPILDGLHGTTIHRDPPRWTRSVDDGLALLAGMDGWWLQRLGRITDQNIYSAVLTNGFQGQDAAAATPALALCAALVRARAKQQEDSSDDRS